jgi:hypothetical protein
MPITDGPYQLDDVGLRYHKDCGVAAAKAAKDAPRGVHATQLPYLATEDAYDKLQKKIDDERKANEEQRAKELEEQQKRQNEAEKQAAAERRAESVVGPHEPAKHAGPVHATAHK